MIVIFCFWRGVTASILGLLTWLGSIIITIYFYIDLSDFLNSQLLNIKILKNYEQITSILSTLISIPLIFLILLIEDGPKPTLWGGFLLNIILAGVAISVGFPLGLLFALGRASQLPAVKIVCTIYIETIRGAPLVGWLLLAWFVLPKFLPEFWNLNETSVVIRAMIILSAFTSAYTAEVIRGGLQSIPKGQIEAADSLNLNLFTKLTLIVLPQAIRVVIRALISTFIAVFKDTSLVFVLALTDLLQVGRIIPEQDPEFFGKALEALSVVAFLFWIVSMALSNLSTRVERSMGIGTR